MFTIAGAGFKSGELLNLWITDSHGTQSLFPSVGTDGTFSTTSYASWTGDSLVKIYDNGGRKMVFLASCAFTVQ